MAGLPPLPLHSQHSWVTTHMSTLRPCGEPSRPVVVKKTNGNTARKALGGGHEILCTVQFHLRDIIFTVRTGIILTRSLLGS